MCWKITSQGFGWNNSPSCHSCSWNWAVGPAIWSHRSAGSLAAWYAVWICVTCWPLQSARSRHDLTENTFATWIGIDHGQFFSVTTAVRRDGCRKYQYVGDCDLCFLSRLYRGLKFSGHQPAQGRILCSSRALPSAKRKSPKWKSGSYRPELSLAVPSWPMLAQASLPLAGWSSVESSAKKTDYQILWLWPMTQNQFFIGEPTKLVVFVVYHSTCGFNNFEPRPYLRNALYPWSPFDPRNLWALQPNGKLRHDLLDQSRAHQLLLHIFSAASLKGLRDQLPHPPGQKLSIKSIKLGRGPQVFSGRRF